KSSLRFRHLDHDAVQRVAEDDLAGEAAVRADVDAAGEHFAFLGAGWGQLSGPVFDDVAVAGGAGHGAAAFADDAGDQVVGGAAHGALAGLAGHGVGLAVGVDEGYAHWCPALPISFEEFLATDLRR